MLNHIVHMLHSRAHGAACSIAILAIIVSAPATTFAQEPEPRGPERRGPGLFGLAADLDADQDGVVSREEFDRGADTIFTELDQNGDGALSEDELPRFRGPRHGHGPRMGRGPGKGPMAGMIVARAADGNRDGEVAREEWQAFLDALEVDAEGSITEDSLRAALPRPPGMASAPPEDHARRSGRLARLLDQDGDSNLTIDDLNAVFAELDQDGDGALLAEELPRFRGHRGPPSH